MQMLKGCEMCQCTSKKKKSSTQYREIPRDESTSTLEQNFKSEVSDHSHSLALH